MHKYFDFPNAFLPTFVFYFFFPNSEPGLVAVQAERRLLHRVAGLAVGASQLGRAILLGGG